MSETPTNPLEEAADAALTVFEDKVRELGGEVETVALFSWTKGIEPNAISAVVTSDPEVGDPQGLLAFLLTQAHELADRIGIDLRIMGDGRPVGEG